MNDKIRGLMDFLDASRSVYHAVAYISEILDKAGYTRLPEGDDWILEDGGKYYITRNMSTVIAYRPVGARRDDEAEPQPVIV